MDAERPPLLKRKRLQYRLGLVFLGLCVFWIITIFTREALLPAGEPAPEWSLVEVSRGRDKLSLGALKGKVVVLDFWALSCPPCVREVEELKAVSRQFDSRDLEVVGISAWGDAMSDLRAFKRGKQINYRLVLGDDRTVVAYKASTLPTLYIIDREGRIAASHQGYLPREDIVEIVEPLLGDTE